MKHADMSPNTKTRVDAGATLGRKLQELENAVRLNAIGHAAEAYVDVKREEYKHALAQLVQEAQLEGRAAAAETGGPATLRDPANYRDDHAGEVRNDPSDGNGFVLRSIFLRDGYVYVSVNDVFGGHGTTMPAHEWLSWPK